MITGVHGLIFSRDADGLRGFFRDVLGFPSVDAGGGWLIFALPPAELGVHPTEGDGHQQLYLLCDDLDATLRDLQAKGAQVARPPSDQGFGRVAWLQVPGGDELAIYQPSHPTAIRPPG